VPLKSGKCSYWTGRLGIEFEQKFAEWCGAKYGTITSSGTTTALHTALGGLGIGPGDEVIVLSYTFIASSDSVAQAGAIRYSPMWNPNPMSSALRMWKQRFLRRPEG